MDGYSVLLALALISAGGALVCATLRPILSRSAPSRAAWARSARGLARLGLALAAGAAMLHLATGHQPGTPGALGPIGFSSEHPALIVAAAMAVVALALCRPQGHDGRSKSPGAPRARNDPSF